jgi:Ca2+-transporting ATPase
MITGDHPTTASTIARELGILTDGQVITGTELDVLSLDELEKIVPKIQVFARVSPEHKLKIVATLQKLGHTVAMTGDGVNDAPALKKADIGIAMGITGADVTKETAVMSLTDDNFASIVASVEEGRAIFANIKKYLMYVLSTNIDELMLILSSFIFTLPLPLSTVQILYVNLSTAGLPALALAVDPPEEGIMKQKPSDHKKGIFTKPVVVLMFIGGLWSAAVNLGLFFWATGNGQNQEKATAMMFIFLVVSQFFKAYGFRAFSRPLQNKPFSNKWLNVAILWEFVLLTFLVYIPFLQKPFGTVSLNHTDWLTIVSLAFTVLLVLELSKWVINRKFSKS